MTERNHKNTRPPIKDATSSLSKRPIEQGMIRQSFSHGRSKQVIVETVKRRGKPVPEVRSSNGRRPAASAHSERDNRGAYSNSKPFASATSQTEGLSQQEIEARAHALLHSVKRSQSAEADLDTNLEDSVADPVQELSSDLPPHSKEIVQSAVNEPEVQHEHQAAQMEGTGEGDAKPKAQVEQRKSGRSASYAPKLSDLKVVSIVERGKPQNLNFMAKPAQKQPQAKDETSRTPSTANATQQSQKTKQSAHPEDREFLRQQLPGLGVPPKRLFTQKPSRYNPSIGGRRKTHLTIASVTAGEEEHTRSIASFRRRQKRMSNQNKQEHVKERLSREVTIPELITIQELANRMSERAVDVIRLLMKQGQIHKITDSIDGDTAQLIAEEFGHQVKRVSESDVEDILLRHEPDLEEDLVPRPPIVTVMGHVDHGKTSLLDAIRQASLAKHEHGGITQHINAYQTSTAKGDLVTFIDTPGHAAFSAMRSRGAKVTDIIVLVIASDDGIKQQTIESIALAKEMKVPLIIAFTKSDLPTKHVEQIRIDLLQHDLQVESLGGDILEFELSSKTGAGIPEFLEGIILQAEIMDLKVSETRDAEGFVIESKLDRGKGPVAAVLIQQGTLFAGDIIVAGAEWGRVRALINDKGEQIAYAEPSTPVEVLGLNGAPDAGDRLIVVDSESKARDVSSYRKRKKRDLNLSMLSRSARSVVERMKDLNGQDKHTAVPLVIKADVQGSAEAIVELLKPLRNEEVSSRIISTGVGLITESDVTLAKTSQAIIVGFNVKPHKEARLLAEREGIKVLHFTVIYELVDEIKALLSEKLSPILKEERIGRAQVLELFNVSKIGQVAGCRVLEGIMQRHAHAKVVRANAVMFEGQLTHLKHLKDDKKEVSSGQECGIAFDQAFEYRTEDIIECYRIHETRRTL